MMDSPMCLISYNEQDKKFHINADAMKLLGAIEGPVGVVTIAGLYRTGKSYILNRLAGFKRGFAIGSTVDPCTIGIYMWIVDSDYISGYSPPQHVTMILLDTEGLGSFKKSKTYDVEIFSLSVLLSSFFIYNSMGAIDETAIDRLSLVTELSRRIRTKETKDLNDSDPSFFRHFFPKFMWLVRDFGLKLSVDDREISADEYLENSLKPTAGIGEKVEAKNAVRASITQYFPERNCFLLKRPVNDESLLQRLDEVDDCDIRPQFLEQVDKLIQFVYDRLEPKRMFGEKLNGSMFCSLVESYVSSINSGSIPVIQNTWNEIKAAEGHKIIRKASQLYESRWNEKEQSTKESLDTETFEACHNQFLLESLKLFNQNYKGEDMGIQVEKLLTKINVESQNRWIQNVEKSKVQCAKIMDQVVHQIDDLIIKDNSMSVDQLEAIWTMLLSQKYIVKGPMKHEILASVLSKKPFEHCSKILKRWNEKYQMDVEKKTLELKSSLEMEYKNLEKLYENVKESWLKAKEDVREMEQENGKLISVVANLSNAINVDGSNK